MMRAVVFLCALFVSTFAQAQLSPPFPPGTFQSRAAIDAGAGYQGPGNVVTGAVAWWGLRGYSAAFSGNVARICDSATGLVCANATWTAGALTVPTISGLVCGVGINCVVTTLFDQSGALSCGGSACDLTQATLANMPAFVINCLGALPCIDFSSGALLQSPSITLTTFSLASVLSADTTDNNVAIFTTLGSAPSIIAAQTNLLKLGDTGFGTSASVTAVAGTFHGIGAIFNGASSNIYVNGSSNPITIGGSSFTNPIRVGAGGSKARFSEIGSWSTIFNGTQAAAMNTNQQAYWGY